MSACAALAQRYVKEVPTLPDGTPNKIPASNASFAEKDKWMLISKWGCVVPPVTIPNMNQQECFANETESPPTENVNQRPPVLNYLQETGFLNWVNERGLKCINKITGNYFGLNLSTGKVNTPSPLVSPPIAQCWGPCRSVTDASSMCFECVNQVLAADPGVCNNVLNPSNPDDEELIQQAVSCHTCIAQQGGFIGQTTPTPIPDNAAIMNNMFNCVLGTVSQPLSVTAIVLLVILGVMVLTAAIILGVYFGVIEPKLKKKQAQDQKIIAKGYNPEDL